MPTYGGVQNFPFGLACRVESLMVSVPVLSLLTKKIALPPSRAKLLRMIVPATVSEYLSPSV